MPTPKETRECIDTAEKAVDFIKKKLQEDGYQLPGKGQQPPESQKDETPPNQESKEDVDD